MPPGAGEPSLVDAHSSPDAAASCCRAHAGHAYGSSGLGGGQPTSADGARATRIVTSTKVNDERRCPPEAEGVMDDSFASHVPLLFHFVSNAILDLF